LAAFETPETATLYLLAYPIVRASKTTYPASSPASKYLPLS